MPRPRKRLRPTDYGRIEEMAARGLSERQIASELGVAARTWHAVKQRDQRAAEALSIGRGREESALVGSLYKSATEKGNVTAAIFLLKARHQYIDQPQPHAAENKVEVTFQIPAPLSRGRYKKLIEVTPGKRLKETRVDAP